MYVCVCVCVCVYEGVGKTFVRFYDFLFYLACSEIQYSVSILHFLQVHLNKLECHGKVNLFQ